MGGRVPDLPGYDFNELRPMPWTGEVYAESSDGERLYRMYFIERRAGWRAPTDMIVGCGTGQKPVREDTTWCSDDQTEDMHSAMKSGVTYCTNVTAKWRRWNTA
ncbi:hypothetical protein HWD35_20680 [Tsukamurella tyrosinosolvens]|uniref:hypothetical protein n=1 Tax=Tsukamurella tyrosinosolvens TaxID=57704 RepID=UPI001CE22EF2|nr:hypothetical protein [Tsukamurella tyrosinosolvens]MCA4997141.1 hypothetical protein [Tsukamurella tyrosinosolvens]